MPDLVARGDALRCPAGTAGTLSVQNTVRESDPTVRVYGTRRGGIASLVSAPKLPVRDVRHDLNENSLARVHPAIVDPPPLPTSNREHGQPLPKPDSCD